MKKKLSIEEKRSKARAYAREYNRKFPEKRASYQKKWRRENLAERAAYARSRRSDNDRRRDRDARLRSYYGISIAEYEKVLAEQGGVCAICEKPQSGTRQARLHVDHCHSSGRVRGLLCSPCNTGIGLFRESHELLAKVGAYLRKPPVAWLADRIVKKKIVRRTSTIAEPQDAANDTQLKLALP